MIRLYNRLLPIEKKKKLTPSTVQPIKPMRLKKRTRANVHFSVVF